MNKVDLVTSCACVPVHAGVSRSRQQQGPRGPIKGLAQPPRTRVSLNRGPVWGRRRQMRRSEPLWCWSPGGTPNGAMTPERGDMDGDSAVFVLIIHAMCVLIKSTVGYSYTCVEDRLTKNIIVIMFFSLHNKMHVNLNCSLKSTKD